MRGVKMLTEMMAVSGGCSYIGYLIEKFGIDHPAWLAAAAMHPEIIVYPVHQAYVAEDGMKEWIVRFMFMKDNDMVPVLVLDDGCTIIPAITRKTRLADDIDMLYQFNSFESANMDSYNG